MQALLPGDGTTEDDALMSAGTHYDYQTQTWIDGHDHAHYELDTDPLRFCGTDIVTCRQAHPAQF
jgi:hypothetical protein